MYSSYLRPLVLKASHRPHASAYRTHRLCKAPYSSSVSPAAQPSGLLLTGLATIAFGVGYAAGFAFPPQNSTVRVLAAGFMPVPPQSPLADSVEGTKITTQIEHDLLDLPEVRKLGSDSSWSASRPFRNIPPQKVIHSLTAGTLRGPGKLAVAPLVFVNQ